MPDLHFAKACNFTAADGSTRLFAPGRHKDVSDEIAGNWFVRAHLMVDGDEALVPPTAPLQHEERIKAKAALDAAEGRAKGAEAERDAAVSRAEKAEADLVVEKQAHAETMSQLDALTAPASDGAPSGPYAIARGHQGSFKVVKGDEVVAEGLKKADAEAKVAELNAQG